MAKNTKAQEVSTGTSDSYTTEEALDIQSPSQIPTVRRAELGTVDKPAVIDRGDDVQKTPAPVVVPVFTEPVISATPADEFDEDEEDEEWPATEDGGDSTQSSESESQSGNRLSQSLQQPAPTTESPSSPTLTGTFAVDSTDGDGPKTEPQPSASQGRKTPAKKAAAKPAHAKQTQPRSRATMMGAEDDFDEFA